MPTNDFKTFCPTDTGTNLETNAAYQADPQLLIGNQSGIARSVLVNKALRQATYISSCLAQFIANVTGLNMNDPAGNITGGTTATIIANMQAAFKLPPTVTRITAGAGVYTPPANVAYLKIRMVGGGGGGFGAASNFGGNGGDTTFGGGGTLLATKGFGNGAIGVNFNAPSAIVLASIISLGQVGYVTGNEPGIGGAGAATPFGGAPYGGYGAPALSGTPNTGCGGGGGSSPIAVAAGTGGGSGGYLEVILTPALACWAPTFAYSIGAGGAAGAAGGGGGAGSGGSGLIVVEEFYQ